jgi:hypothetical protein
MHKSAVLFFMLMIPLLSGGCAMHWQAPWPEAGVSRPAGRTDALQKAADDCFAAAADGIAVDRCIGMYEAVLAENPRQYRALVQAASLYTLKGTAYTESSFDKSDAFRKAMKYAELAMYTNPAFKQMADAGIPPWEAADTLGETEVEAMFLWVTALQYEFKEGMWLPSKVVNLSWMERAMVFLNRIEAVAPSFGGGGVEFAKVICYMILPESRGGSKAKGDLYMQRAVAKGGDWLLPRWARGKYYFPVKGDDQNAAIDLAWVAGQNPAGFKDPYPWRIHFQADARQKLKQ